MTKFDENWVAAEEAKRQWMAASCDAESPCCEGYSCTSGYCSGCPGAGQPCVEGPGSDPDAGF